MADNQQAQPQRRAVYHPRYPRLPPSAWLGSIFEEIFGSPDAKWGMFRPWVKAAKLNGTWTEWDLRDVVKREPIDNLNPSLQTPETSRRRAGRFQFENELRDDVRPSQIDLVALGGYRTHPADYADRFFEVHFRNLYAKTVEFAAKWFDCNVDFQQIPNSQFVWDSNLTEQFREYARNVAHEDRYRGGWPIILNNPTQRKWLIAGILAKIMEKKIFSSYLFGSDDETDAELLRIDTRNRFGDAYYNKSMRATTARLALRGNLVPIDFWVSVDELAARTAKIFLPLLSVMSQVIPNANASYNIEVFLSELHYILGYAAWFQVCTAVSPTIFNYAPAVPGARMDYATERQSDIPLYADSKDFYAARERRWNQRVERARRGEEFGPVPNAGFKVPRDDTEYRNMQHNRLRGAKIKIAVFPRLFRYTPVNKDWGAPEKYPRKADEALWEEQRGDIEGQMETDITDNMVVYYQGLINPPEDVIEAYSLDDHLKAMGEASNGALLWVLFGLRRLLMWLYVWTLRILGLTPLFLAAVCLAIGYEYGYYLARGYFVPVILIFALTCWYAKHQLDQNRVEKSVLIALVPFVYIGLAGLLWRGSADSDNTWLVLDRLVNIGHIFTYAKESITGLF
ncbi:hypothetical protein GGR52DRAFT_592606 [Hypoxylon sp. FL1284]|nr:hypothetical protein GGR52DRAFT_592606 [Hypoxylon sp. FL1284]